MLEDKYYIYFPDGDVQPTIDLGEMLKELTSIVEWRTLLLNLGMDKYKIDEIEEDYDKIEHRKQEGLDRWLRNKHDACWNDIIKALFEMGQDTLARALEEKYTWKDSMVQLTCTYKYTFIHPDSGKTYGVS